MTFNIASSVAIHNKVNDWVQRVQKNGGATPSFYTINALSTFYRGLDNANLTNKIKSLNAFVPDNLIAAITPLVNTYGNTPWTNNGFVTSDLTIAGLKSDGSTKYLDSGINPSVCMITGSGGTSIYCTQDANTHAVGNEVGVWTINAAGPTFSAYLNADATYNYFDCWNYVGGRIRATPVGVLGFYSFNRTSTTDSNICRANSTSPYQVLGFGTGQTNIGAPPNVSCYVFRMNGNATITTKRFSCVAFHDGLSLVDGKAFYDLIQSMRQQLGGGYV